MSVYGEGIWASKYRLSRLPTDNILQTCKKVMNRGKFEMICMILAPA